MLWSEVRLRGKPPERRSYHSAVEHDGDMYIFGGPDTILWKINLDGIIEDSPEN